MTPLRALLLCSLLGTWACGAGERAKTPGEPNDGTGARGAADATGGAMDAAAGAALGGGHSAGGAAAGAPGDVPGESELEIVEVEDTPCELTQAEANTFMEPEPLELSFDRAGAVGERRFALDTASLALITFAPDGSDPSAIEYSDFVAATGFQERLVTLELAAEGELVARAYDALASEPSAPLSLDEIGTGSHAVAASPDGVLAVWRSEDELRGQLFTPGQALSERFDFGRLSCGEHSCTPYVLWNGDRFLVLWTRVEASGHSTLSWAAVDAAGKVVGAKNVLGAEDSYRLAGAASLADAGAALLLTEGAPARAPLLVLIDAFGRPRPTLRRFLGATEAWGIASAGSKLALVARSSSAQAVFRPLAADGEPVSGWVCVDDSGMDTDFEPRVALFAADDAYGAVVRHTDGSAVHLELDVLGHARE